jgi:hypothetical protein
MIHPTAQSTGMDEPMRVLTVRSYWLLTKLVVDAMLAYLKRMGLSNISGNHDPCTTLGRFLGQRPSSINSTGLPHKIPWVEDEWTTAQIPRKCTRTLGNLAWNKCQVLLTYTESS